MKTLILGAGNLLLSDEGFGVHFIRFLKEHYHFPEEVELYDAGTLGIMAAYKIEEADRVYVVDAVDCDGEPGTFRRYSKEEFSLQRLPIKLSPHQAGVQEMLLVSALRDRCPREVILLGAVPASLEPGVELSPVLKDHLPKLAEDLAEELSALGYSVSRAAIGSVREV